MAVSRWGLILFMMWPACAVAQGASLFAPARTNPIFTPRPDVLAPRQSASLFTGKSESGLFAPWPDRPAPDNRRADPFPVRGGAADQIAQLKSLIASVEAGPAGYDAVQYGARIRPAQKPTQMRIREIRAWVAATPGQPHAIGRYQFIPPTFNALIQQLGIGDNVLFTPAVQDRMARQLLDQAGLARFLSGNMGRVAFMNQLARIWAGLPNSTGKSHYHGYAGNKAAMSWARFEREMTRIFPRMGA